MKTAILRGVLGLVISLVGCRGGGGNEPDLDTDAEADGSAGSEMSVDGAREVGGPEPEGPSGAALDGGLPGTAPPVPDGYKLDVVFVVGRKPGMADVQRRLAAAVPAFLAELGRRRVLDVHIGVTTTHAGFLPGAGDNAHPDCRTGTDIGRLLQPASCAMTRAYLRVGAGADADTDAADKLACALRVGTEGCVFPMPLNAMEAMWRGGRFRYGQFMRDDADLLYVILTNEDDCSEDESGQNYGAYFRYRPGEFRRFRCAWNGHECNQQALEPVAQSHAFPECRVRDSGNGMLTPMRRYVPFFEEIRQWKRDGRAWLRDLRLPPAPIPEPRVMVAALSGWPEDPGTARYEYRTFPSSMGEPLLDVAPVCGQGAGEARPGFRLRALTEALPAGDGLFLSVCGEDLRPALVQVAGLPGAGVARQ